MPIHDGSGADTHWSERLDIAIARAARMLAMFAVGVLLFFSLLVILNVVLRWLFGLPLLWVTDVQSLIVAVAIAGCFATSLADRHHIRLRLLGSLVGPRGQQFLETVAAAATFVIFALLVWQLVVFTERNMVRGLVTTLMAWPRAPFWWIATGFVAFAAVLQALGLLVDIIRTFRGVAAPDRRTALVSAEKDL